MDRRDGGSLVIKTVDSDLLSSDVDSDADPPRPFEISSYLDLLQFPKIPATGKEIPSGRRDISTPVVDAILVPTFRSAEQIKCAVDLASQARCELLLLYTDDFPSELPDVLAGLKRGQAVPLALRSELRNPHLLDLGADLPQSFASKAALDISRKRNLGLLIGRMRGWTRMLLLDDDIRQLTIEKLSAAAALLDEYPVVGLQVSKFPDASVVGHARRRNGRRQEPFVSGGSLLLDPHQISGYFPAIYHEDWLCTINHLRAGEVAIGGMVKQKSCNPFASPERAKNEEFGDILAAGLLWLVYKRKKTNAADPVAAESEADYWREATMPSFWARLLDERIVLLKEVAEDLETQYPDDKLAHRTLAIAQERCGELTVDEFVEVTKKWMSNLDLWRERVSRLPRVDSVEKALAELGVLNIVRRYPVVSPKASADPARGRRQAIFFAVGSAVVVLGGLALGVLRKFRRSAGASTLSAGHDSAGHDSAGHDGGSRLGRVQPGRRARGGPQRPPAVGEQAEHHDGHAAAGQEQPVDVTGRDEPGAELAAQVGGQD
jgi:hypothetical protein